MDLLEQCKDHYARLKMMRNPLEMNLKMKTAYDRVEEAMGAKRCLGG
jgi:hypothetical protein